MKTNATNLKNRRKVQKKGKLWSALSEETPLQMVGVINAYAAILAESVGFRALYLSGAGVANASYGIPDLGMTTLDNVAEDVRRICGATLLPLLVDADTGWGSTAVIGRTIRKISRAGAAGVHLEDQIESKRCGHRPNKVLVRPAEMMDRIKAAVDARSDPSFAIMARTDAVSVEGLEAAIERACLYREAGADMIFPEALSDLEQYRRFVTATKLPVLANVTEFGLTPLYTTDELKSAGVKIVLYPLSAFRAMSAAALNVYKSIRKDGTQKRVIKTMQTRKELYRFLDYEKYEKSIDKTLNQEEIDESKNRRIS
jgi:methylisocitrate lyase